MNEGWIKMHRKMLDWEWIDDPYMVAFWLRLLFAVNTKDRRWQGRLIKRGQTLTSVRHLAAMMNMDEKTVHRILKKLNSTGEITVETDKNGTLITVSNFARYQGEGAGTNPTPNPTPRPTPNPTPNPTPRPTPRPTNLRNIESEELKKSRMQETRSTLPARGAHEGGGFDPSETYGVMHNVRMAQAQYRQLVETYGQDATQTVVDELSCKLAEGSYETNDHYATLTYWLSYRQRMNTGRVPMSSTQAAIDPDEQRQRAVWETCTPQEQQQYLDTHGGKKPWEIKQ